MDKKGGHREKNQDDSTNLSNEQVMVSILKTGYTRATDRHVIEKTPSPECPFCGVSLTSEQILWECTETTREREEKPEPRKRYGQMEQKDRKH
jgi:hypothetical protein